MLQDLQNLVQKTVRVCPLFGVLQTHRRWRQFAEPRRLTAGGAAVPIGRTPVTGEVAGRSPRQDGRIHPSRVRFEVGRKGEL